MLRELRYNTTFTFVEDGMRFVRASRSREHRSQLLLTLITQETLEQFSIHEAQTRILKLFLDSNNNSDTLTCTQTQDRSKTRFVLQIRVSSSSPTTQIPLQRCNGGILNAFVCGTHQEDASILNILALQETSTCQFQCPFCLQICNHTCK